MHPENIFQSHNTSIDMYCFLLQILNTSLFKSLIKLCEYLALCLFLLFIPDNNEKPCNRKFLSFFPRPAIELFMIVDIVAVH